MYIAMRRDGQCSVVLYKLYQGHGLAICPLLDPTQSAQPMVCAIDFDEYCHALTLDMTTSHLMVGFYGADAIVKVHG